MIIKNPIEVVSGSILCEVLIGDKFKTCTISSDEEYKIHESSDWSDIKPCDPVEKTAHEAGQAQDLINQEAIKYLNDTDKFFTRLSETGKAMPESMAEARAAARERIKV